MWCIPIIVAIVLAAAFWFIPKILAEAIIKKEDEKLSSSKKEDFDEK